ncbi:MAG: hypothetical protein K2L10_01250 [Ruminococcus sp.]|nr:hypothetical protein [Ruminococcus sp.]
MYVKRLFYDKLLNGKYYPFNEIENPEWSNVKDILLKLDGQNVSEITMDNGDEDSYLCVAGGNNGLFILYIVLNDNSEFYNLLNPSPENKINRLVTGGQWGDFEDRFCNNLTSVIKVAENYFRTGEISDKYKWEIIN